jgi:hypothetical protein
VVQDRGEDFDVSVGGEADAVFGYQFGAQLAIVVDLAVAGDHPAARVGRGCALPFGSMMARQRKPKTCRNRALRTHAVILDGTGINNT